MNHLHITLTPFKNESRILKEVRSISNSGGLGVIHISALIEEGLLKEEVIDEKIYLNRIDLLLRKLPKSVFFQMIKYIELLIRMYFYYRKKKIGIINVHSLDLLPIGCVLKALFKSKLIYDTHELETERNGLHGLRKKISKWVEKICLKYTDQVFVVSNSISEYYSDEYKISLPPVIFNCPNYTLPPKSDLLRQKLGIQSDSLIYLYQGGLVPGRGVESILDAFRSYGNQERVVVFMGYGLLADEIKSAALNSQNIFFHDAVPPDQLLNYTSSADIGLSLIENTCKSYYFCMPNKIFEYLMAGLPIIASNMLDMKKFIEEYELGVILERNSEGSIRSAVDQIEKMDLILLRKNALYYAKQFCWEAQEYKLKLAYEQLEQPEELNK